MNWFKENPVLAAVLAFAVLGTAVTGYLAMEAGARRSAAIDDLNSKITTLRRLQAKQPFPDAANAAKVQSAVEAYATEIASFKKDLAAKEAPLEDIKPQDFQDALRNAVDALRNAARQNGVALPEKFFYGFDDFQTQLPTEDQTPLLNREFLVIRNLVDQLVALRIQSLDSLVRHAATPKKPTPATPEEPEETGPAFDSFTLAFTAPQEKFAAAFDKIPEAGAFVVVRSMTLENSNPAPPPRAEPATGAATTIFPGEADSAEAQLPVVFGREAVQATLLLEIPDFPDPPAPNETPNPAPQS
jgi:hypothetical protein